MSREILFRAKRIEDGRWVEGDLLRETNIFGEKLTRIFVDMGNHHWVKHDVNPDTVCQYTGFHDKRGNRIYENDIVGIGGIKPDGWVRFGCYAGDALNADSVCGWFINFLPEEEVYRHDFGYWLKKLTIIGNIFDNGELLDCNKRVEQQVIQDVLLPAT